MPENQIFIKSLNSGSIPEGFEVAALNFEMPGNGSEAGLPEWIPLLPSGGKVEGRDGRWWINSTPQAIIDHFNAQKRDMVIDWEHSSELKAPNGDPAPAAAWGKEMKLTAAVPWLRVDWTPKGRESVLNREYRYYSPVIVYKKDTKEIVGITSIGLTNKQNLFLSALNQQFKTEDTTMWKELLKLLGLAETATEAEAINSVTKLKGDLDASRNAETKAKADLAIALNKVENPSLEKFVPRPDYDAAIARATNAEKILADQKKTETETAINTEVDAAIKSGKITPASKDFYLATCRQEGGLERFKAFIAGAPQIIKDSNLDNLNPDNRSALNSETLNIAGMMGVSVEDIKKYGSR